MKKELVWNVYTYNFNGREIEVYNIFEHCGFLKALYKAKKEFLKKDNFQFDAFMKEADNSLLYYYWAKCEWETIISSWPAYIDGEELDRLIKEKSDRESQGQRFYRESVNTAGSIKVDVYEQVKMNWHAFTEYMFNNYKLIKKVEK